MSASWLIGISIIILSIAYIIYGRFLSKQFGINPQRPTLVNATPDGVDYVSIKAPVLFEHHFASITGAGPILGPIYAAIFGWIPVLLWILIGSIIVGGVHDFSALIASVRHGGKSIGEVIEEHIGRSGKKLFLIFIWSVLFMILAVLFGLSVYRWKVSLFISSTIGVILLITCIVVGVFFPWEQSYNVWIILLKKSRNLCNLWSFRLI